MVAVRKRRKKVPKVYSRRARTGFNAAPQDSFRHFNDYVRVEVDRKEISAKIKAFIKREYPKKEQKVLLAAPDWVYPAAYFLASTIAWEEFEQPFPDTWDRDKVVKNQIAYIKDHAEAKLKEKEENADKPKKVTRSPMEIVKERTSDFIGEVEFILDEFHNGVWIDIENYSVYNELMIINAPGHIARKVVDYYTPLKEELEGLFVKKKDPNLLEGYRHLTAKKKRDYLKLVNVIIDDAERYLASKKATRKTRSKAAPKAADKQVEKVNYLKESKEYKVTSIMPNQIVGAHRVFLFRENERMLVELVSRSATGFSVSGTTIQDVDLEASRTVRLRKPTDFLPIVLSKTVNQIDKEWVKLTTKTTKDMTGRINKHTIILRALDH